MVAECDGLTEMMNECFLPQPTPHHMHLLLKAMSLTSPLESFVLAASQTMVSSYLHS